MVIVALIGILIILFMLSSIVCIRHYSVKVEKLHSDLRLVQISDFHCGKAGKIIELTLQQNPDLILITGDLYDQRRTDETVIQLIRGIKACAPIYYVSGNHEYKDKHVSYNQIRERLKQEGVHVLDNEVIQLDHQIELIGIEDCRHFETGNEWGQEKREIDRLMSLTHPEYVHIVMIHKPDHYIQMNEYSIDLMCSGHAHGGQWRIPGVLNGVFAPHQGFFPKRAGGIYPLEKGVHVVSRGLSNFIWLPRLFNRPELVVIDLKKK